MAQQKSLAKFRVPIYDWMRAQGIEFTKQRHDELKALLTQHDDARVVSLEMQLGALNAHMNRCRLAKRDRQRALMEKRNANTTPPR